MNFIDKNNRAPTVKTALLFGFGNHLAQFGHAAGRRVHRHEFALREVSDNAGNCCLTGAGRSE